MSVDAETLAVYAARADDCADMPVDAVQKTMLAAFIDAMPKGARVLDLGCGPGLAAAAMLKSGLQVDAHDATPEMARLAARHQGVNVAQKSFDELDADNLYHGIWASFSLLHAPKSAFPTHLQAIHRALRPGGLLCLAMKLGKGEIRDKLGRLYTYYSQSELQDLLVAADFTPGDHSIGQSTGLAGDTSPFIIANAHA